jgi:hypothetical protein
MSTTQDVTTQPVVTTQPAVITQPTVETPSSGVTFVSTPTNNSSVGPDPVTPHTNFGVNQSPNVIGNQTNTSGNSSTTANCNQRGNQLPNEIGNEQTNLGSANTRPNIMIGIAKDHMSSILERDGLKRGYYPSIARFPTALVPQATPKQMNIMAQTPIDTQVLINKSRAVRRTTHAEMASSPSTSGTIAYVADQTIDWLVDLTNIKLCPRLLMPLLQFGFVC